MDLDKGTTPEQPTQSRPSYDSGFDQHMQGKLPADNSATTFGIISVISGVLTCCTGITGLVGIVLGIIGLNKANASLKLYRENPKQYHPASYNSVNNGKTWNIVGLIVSSLFFAFMVAYFIFAGAMFWTAFKQGLDQGMNGQQNEWQYEDNSEGYEYETDEYEQIEGMEEVDPSETNPSTDNDTLYIE